MLRILYDDFDQKVKNIHDEMDLHHSYKKTCTFNSSNKIIKVIFCFFVKPPGNITCNNENCLYFTSTHC